MSRWSQRISPILPQILRRAAGGVGGVHAELSQLDRESAETERVVNKGEEGPLPDDVVLATVGQGRAEEGALAVAHRMFTIVSHIIAEGGRYQEVGANFYEKQHPDRSARPLLRRLEQLDST